MSENASIVEMRKNSIFDDQIGQHVRKLLPFDYFNGLFSTNV